MKTTLIFWRISHLFWLNIVIFALTMMVFITLPSCENDESTSLNDEVSLKTSSTTEILYFGHKTFTRGTGTPVIISHPIENPDFDHFEDNFILQIQNGKDSKTRVSSAEIWIDGVLVVGPSDFSQNVSFISRQLSCLTPESLLEVKLSGKPGSCIDLWIEGCLKPGRALVGSEGGSITSADGTVEVVVPNGAIAENEILGINLVENLYYGKSEIAESIGPAVELVGFEDVFLKDIELIIHLSSEIVNRLDGQHEIGIYQIREDLLAYIYLESYFNEEDLTLSTNLKHFSSYSVVLTGDKISFFGGPTDFYWSVQNYPVLNGEADSYLPKEEVDKALAQAINSWGQYLSKAGYTFEQKDYANFNNWIDEIMVSWVNDLTWRDRTAYALGGYSFHFDSRVVLFNNEYFKWIANIIPRETIPENSQVQSIRSTMLHEFGHVLGLKHLYERPCGNSIKPEYCYGPIIMVPYNGYKKDYFELDPIDIERLCSKYGISLEGNSFRDEFYNLDNNKVPLGWNFFVTNEDVSLKDGRLVATPIDAYGGLRRNGTMPDGYSKIKFEWDGNLASTTWGMLNILKINYSGNKAFQVYLETAKVWSSTNNFLFLQYNDETGHQIEKYKDLVPLQYGEFHYTVTVSNNQIDFKCKKLGDQQYYIEQLIPIPLEIGFSLQAINGYEYIAYTTTENDNWLDNISVTLIK